MPQKFKIKAILRKARVVKHVWQKNPEFMIGEVELAGFISKLSAAEALEKRLAAKRIELIVIRAERDDKCGELNDLITRFRSGMRAHFGPDSVQYIQSVAKPKRGRRPAKRKKAHAER